MRIAASSAELDDVRLRLREWACFFRDRVRQCRTYSIEGNWRSPQVWEAEKPKPAYDPRRAVSTWAAMKALDGDGIGEVRPAPLYRALTWRYCYPWLPTGIPLRALSRRVGYRVNAKQYEELVLLGELRLAALFYKEDALGYNPALGRTSGQGRAITHSREAGASAS